MSVDKRKRAASEPASKNVQQHKKQKQETTQKAGGKAPSKPQGKHAKNGKPAAAKAAAPAAKAVPVAVVANSNWAAMKQKIQQKDKKFSGTTEKKHDLDVKAHKIKVKELKQTKKKEAKTAEWIDNSLIVAMDCEMVGVGLSGKQSVLARCSIVDYDGNVLYDKTVRPVEKVTDFRTHVSGIRSRMLKNAIPFAQCLKEVGKLMKDKIIVGHALSNDFKALMFTPPKNLIRDTAKYRPYMRRKMTGTKLFPKSLKHLADEFLGIKIQTGEHDSVEDARATLKLYKREQYAWEKYLRTNKSASSLVGIAPPLPKEKTNEPPRMSAIGEDDEESDSDNEYGASTKSGGTYTVPDSKELSINEFAE